MTQVNTPTAQANPASEASHVTPQAGGSPAAWYSVRQRTPLASAVAAGVKASAEIYIYGDIGESWWEETTSARSFVRDLAELDVDAITIRINSYGGSVPDGTAIHNAIKRHRAHITTVVDGVAFSIASLIAIAGDTVEMAENAVFMLHAPWTYAAGNAQELRASADMLDQFAQAMATSYAAKTGKPLDEVLALISDGQDHYYTAAEAQAFGFVDAVTTALPLQASAQLDAKGLARWGDRATQAAARLTAPGASPVAAPAAAPASAHTSAPAAPHLAPQPSSPAAPAASIPTQEPSNMTTPAAAAPAQTNTPAAPAASQVTQAEVLAADAQRRNGIRAAFAPFAAREGVAALQRQCEDDHAVTADAAGTRLLAHLGSQASPIAGGRVATVEDEADKRRSAQALAVIARTGIQMSKDGPARVDASNPYRGMRLYDLARDAAVRAGVRVDGMRPIEVVSAAFTQGTSDFPILLENVMHKTLQAGYAVQPDTWTLFCARGQVSDFRAHPRYRVGSLSNLDSKTELGEFKNKTIPDGEKASITAATKGNIINISREAVINDDLGAFIGLANMLGRAAKRTVEADVYATLALNAGMGPTLLDGVTLFHASHNNVSTGAPTVASFDAARVVLRAQKDVSGNDYLDLSPAVWLGPDAIQGSAKVVNNSTYDPDTANKLQRANIAFGIVQTIVGTPRLSSTPWYFFADPNVAPVIEVAFLDGISEPFLEMEQGFTVDGSRWKVRLDYGVAGVDYRGAVRSTGA